MKDKFPEEHIRALREYGLRYDNRYKVWKGSDYHLAEREIGKLDLWELDQVLAGLRDGAHRVRVRKGYFYIHTDEV